MQSEPTKHEIELLRALAGEIFLDAWGAWMTEAAESLRGLGYCTGAPNYQITEAGRAFLANRKEVMPHVQSAADGAAPRRDTTPPQASEPGVIDYADLLDFYASKQSGEPGICRVTRSSLSDAAAEIRRLRTREAEQAARIAALEAGLRLAAYELNITRGYPHVGRQISIEAALTVAARLLPQEGK